MADRPRIMLVEDDADLAQATAETLEHAGFAVETHASAAPALSALTSDWPGVVLSDVRMPGMSGLDLLDRAREIAPNVPFVVITGHGDVQGALRAMRAGAHDFLEKPCDPQLLIDILRRAAEMRRLQLENAELRKQLERSILPIDKLLGRSVLMVDLRRRVAVLAALHVDLLISGETGTGKEMVARCLHDMSMRRLGPFVALNCGALTEADVDRELFGVAGEHSGRVAAADGGTLYLDELESMPDALQVRLLRVLDAREISPMGGAMRAVDIRILGSVKADPADLIAEGRLRADLFHRFNAGALRLPPLRERDGDVLLLIEHFAAEAAARHNLPKPALDAALRRQAEYHHWPGNVREARNMAERMVIGLEPSFASPGRPAVTVEDYDAAMEAFENRLLQAALLQTGGRKTEAASLLGIPRKRLYLRLRHHGLA